MSLRKPPGHSRSPPPPPEPRREVAVAEEGGEDKGLFPKSARYGPLMFLSIQYASDITVGRIF
jgi:hypothetical protein